MLEKNEKNLQNCYCDAHFHYSDCKHDNALDYDNVIIGRDPIISENWYGCTTAHSITEWENQNAAPEKEHLIQAFGMHPQSAGFIDIEKNTAFLEKLIQNKEVSAIGEAGFDNFTEEFRSLSATQEKMWNIQLELATSANLPLVVHCRKANEKLFEYSKQLKKLPAVLFHSFMGTPVEALSLRRRGINAYFSFGKQLLNNNKKTIACMSELPLEMLMCETDAPFQFLKNQQRTYVSEIKDIYKAAFSLRKDCESFEQFQNQLYKNFLILFMYPKPFNFGIL